MSETPVDKVLIISYYWPPAGGPGVQRWLKLTKYLARLGVQIFVVTVDPEKGTYPLKDQSLSKDVDDRIRVIRTDTSEKFNLYKKLTRKKEVPFSGFANESSQPSLIQKIARFARGNFMYPDARRGWNKHAYQAAKDVIVSEQINWVITTSPPHSTQLVGKRLKEELNVNWLADMRDPWTDIYYYNLFYPTSRTRRIEREMERLVLIKADIVTTVSESLRSIFIGKDRTLDGNKIHVLPNGYDPQDFTDYSKEASSKFTLTYAGTITQQYPIDGVISALGKLPFEVKLRFIGRWDSHTEEATAKANSNVEVEWISYVEKAELNAFLVQTDMLLLVIPDIENNEGIVTGKIFDYLGSGSPILGVGPIPGDAAEILEDTQFGRMFHYQDSDEIAKFIEQCSKDEIEPDTQRRARYNREQQASDLLRLMTKS